MSYVPGAEVQGVDPGKDISASVFGDGSHLLNLCLVPKTLASRDCYRKM
jgi:hypothetical protein